MRLVLSASLVLLIAIPAAADFKIVTRVTYPGGRSFTETRLVQGVRQRVGSTGSGWVAIYQCDKQQLVQLNPATRLFSVGLLGPDGRPQITRRPGSPNQPATLYHYSVTTEETGERATVFGYPAWRVRDVILTDPQGPRTVVDSWYVDLPILWGCRKPELPAFLDSLPDEVITQKGFARRGFPVLTRQVFEWADRKSEIVSQVTELSTQPLDRGLFEIPPGYGRGLDGSLTVPDTLAARARIAWDNMWVNAARFFFEK